MRRTALLVVLSSLAFAPAPVYRVKPDKRTDLDKMQGAWVRVSISINGQRHEEAVGSTVVIIKGDTMSFGSPTDTWRLTLDATKSPKRIDRPQLGGSLCFLEIYKLEGDSLVLCSRESKSESDRPAGFDPAVQPGVWLHAYERKKP